MDTGTPIWKLIQACKLGGATLWRQALRTADVDFGLHSRLDVIRFIANGGLEDVALIMTKPLENNDTGSPVDVHSYRFRAGKKEGYLAFYVGVPLYVIKSFKLNIYPPIRKPPLKK